jgi:hypothetical protein
VVRWRRIDLAERIKSEFEVKLDVRTVGTMMRNLNFRRISVRPRHPSSDEAAQDAFKKTSPNWRPRRSLSPRAASRSSCGGRTKPASVSKQR